MRKLFITLLLLLSVSALSYSSRIIPYTIKCYKCKESYLKNPHGGANPNTNANRHCELEHDGYCVYKCQHGHTLYVNFDTGDRK